MATRQIVLRFSYFEHDWADQYMDDLPGAEAELLRRADEGEWEEISDDEPDEFDSVDGLARKLEDVLVGEWKVPAEAARLPMEKLRNIIADGGWTFVAGDFTELVGNHHDTELSVMLVRHTGAD
jgi:hypothetical protein